MPIFEQMTAITGPRTTFPTLPTARTPGMHTGIPDPTAASIVNASGGDSFQRDAVRAQGGMNDQPAQVLRREVAAIVAGVTEKRFGGVVDTSDLHDEDKTGSNSWSNYDKLPELAALFRLLCGERDPHTMHILEEGPGTVLSTAAFFAAQGCPVTLVEEYAGWFGFVSSTVRAMPPTMASLIGCYPKNSIPNVPIDLLVAVAPFPRYVASFVFDRVVRGGYVMLQENDCPPPPELLNCTDRWLNIYSDNIGYGVFESVYCYFFSHLHIFRRL